MLYEAPDIDVKNNCFSERNLLFSSNISLLLSVKGCHRKSLKYFADSKTHPAQSGNLVTLKIS